MCIKYVEVEVYVFQVFCIMMWVSYLKKTSIIKKTTANKEVLPSSCNIERSSLKILS